MFQTCKYCGDAHIVSCCHKGMQLIRFMKNTDLLLDCSMNELRWLCKYYKIKPTKQKRIMINQLIKLNKNENLYECPICYEPMSLEKTVITPCGHAFCDTCIITYMQTKDECPLCRSYFTIVYLLLVIPKDRVVEIYKNIYSISIGEPDYTQHIMGGTDGYIFDQEDIEQLSIRQYYSEVPRNYFVIFILTFVFIYYISCMYKKIEDHV